MAWQLTYHADWFGMTELTLGIVLGETIDSGLTALHARHVKLSRELEN